MIKMTLHPIFNGVIYTLTLLLNILNFLYEFQESIYICLGGQYINKKS